MAPQLPLIERTNALPLSTFHSLYFPQTYPSLTHINPKSGTSYQISLHTPDNVGISSCFNLIAATSRSNYASSSAGWHPKSKRKEMLLPDLRYLVVTSIQSPEAPLKGFLSFMLTYEDGKEVIYVYELHLTEDVRGGGLGKQLMELVEDVGRKVGVEKVMLTVFVANVGGWKFYEKLGYEIDEFSPEPRRLRGGVVKEPDYVILSKGLRGKEEAQVTSANET